MGKAMTKNATAQPPKSVEQIRREWETIEAKQPGGGSISGVLALQDRAAQSPSEITKREHHLIQIISTLDHTVGASHAEMGILLTALATHGIDLERLRGQLQSTADRLESVTEKLAQAATGNTPTGMHEILVTARVQLHCAKHTLRGGEGANA